MLFNFLDACLEFLASQVDPVKFNDMLACLATEKDVEVPDAVDKVELWLRLCKSNEVMILSEHYDGDSIEYAKQLTTLSGIPEQRQLLKHALGLMNTNFMSYIDNSKLLGSNRLRIRKLNLAFCENIFKSTKRYHILLAIASRRYKGYWHHELVNDLGIPPRDLFTHLVSMTKMSLLCKVSLTQDYVSKHVLKSKLDRCSSANKSGSGDAVSEGNISQYQATLWFHVRYFVFDLLPDFVQELYLKSTVKEMEEHLMKVLNESDNRILLESDWKHSYVSKLMKDNSLENSMVDSRFVNRGYTSLRRSLENKSIIQRVFAWCPQKKSFERCIIPYGWQSDASSQNSGTQQDFRTVNLMDTIHMGDSLAPCPSDATSEYLSQPLLYQNPTHMYGHTLSEYIYYIVGCNTNGIGTNDLGKYLGVRYKFLMRLIGAMDSDGLLQKEPVRLGKVLMYNYKLKKKCAIVSSIKNDGKPKSQKKSTSSSMQNEESDASRSTGMDSKTAPSTKTSLQKAKGFVPPGGRLIAINDAFQGMSPVAMNMTRTKESPLANVVSQTESPLPDSEEASVESGGTYFGLTDTATDRSNGGGAATTSSHLHYLEWVSHIRELYPSDESYKSRFIELFGKDFSLPSAINTCTFRRRMVLLTEYIESYKAANFKAISDMYGDVESSSTVVDRKTVKRVHQYVSARRRHIVQSHAQNIKGIFCPLSILYDSRQLDELQAFKLVNEEIAARRMLVSSRSASLRNRINKKFKSPEDISESNTLTTTINVPDSLEVIYKRPLPGELSLLLKDVEVSKMDDDEPSTKYGLASSQRNLLDNGYIFPIVTRVMFLHRFIMEIFPPGMRFSAFQALYRMPMDLYLQIIGCGHEIENMTALVRGRICPEHNKELLHEALFKEKGPRDPVALMHRMLNIMDKIGIVREYGVPLVDGKESDIPQCEINWEVVQLVTLPSLKDNNQVSASFDVLASFDEFWDALQSEVYDYISLEKTSLPENMPVRELFNKKNWKIRSYVYNAHKIQLQEAISDWCHQTLHGIDSGSMERLMYMPPYIVKKFMSDHTISQDDLFCCLSQQIRKMDLEGNDYLMNSDIMTLVNDMTCDLEYLWLGKYVMAERLSHSAFYDALSSDDSNPHKGAITWGVLREKFYEMDETTSSTDESVRDPTSDGHGDHASKGVRNIPRASNKGYINRTGRDVTAKGLKENFKGRKEEGDYSIWSMMSLLFDNAYSPDDCRYVVSQLLNTSSRMMRIISRLREMNTIDITKFSLGSYVSSNCIVTNKDLFISKDQEKAILKSVIFTPVVSMRPWFLKTFDGMKRISLILRQWYSNGWVVRTKQTSNIYTLFKLSNRSKVQLFGKFRDIKLMAELLQSHLSILKNCSDTFHSFSLSLGSSYGSNARHENHSDVNLDSSGVKYFSCNSENTDLHGTYSLIEHFVNGKVSFNPIWAKGAFSSNNKRARLSCDRINNGGISRHLQELTPDVITIKSVNITASYDKDRLDAWKCTLDENGSKIACHFGRTIPREFLCRNVFSDAVNPLDCDAACLTTAVNRHYPLCNYEYESDMPNNWWTDNGYIRITVSGLAIDESEGSINRKKRGRPKHMCHGSAVENQLDSTIKQVIVAYYGEVPHEMEPMLRDMEGHLYNLACIVKAAGSQGIVESALRQSLWNNTSHGEDNKCVSVNGNEILVREVIFEVVMLTLEVLRFVVRLPSNLEYSYLYWDYSSSICATVQPIVALRPYGKDDEPPSEDLATRVLERPEYIAPILWLLYEEPLACKFTEDTLEEVLGPLNRLVVDRDTKERYMMHCMKVPLGSFTSVDGHLNLSFVAFLMLRIASILKSSPGQTVKEVWEKLVILDLCEVKWVMSFMKSLGMCEVASIDACTATHCEPSVENCSHTPGIHSMREDSLWLSRFRALLLPH